MDTQQLKSIIEAALLAAGSPLAIEQLSALFGDEAAPDKKEIRAVLNELQADYEGRGIEIKEVASGFRVQVREQMCTQRRASPHVRRGAMGTQARKPSRARKTRMKGNDESTLV